MKLTNQLPKVTFSYGPNIDIYVYSAMVTAMKGFKIEGPHILSGKFTHFENIFHALGN